METDLHLTRDAQHIVKVVTPVTMCMALVLAITASVQFYSEDDHVYFVYAPFHETSSDAWTIAWNAVANAAILLGVIIGVTVRFHKTNNALVFIVPCSHSPTLFSQCLVIVAYKNECYIPIHVWQLISSTLLLTLFTILFLGEVLKAFNLPIDNITLAFLLWNFAVVGIICIHWKGPLRLQQAYQIFLCVLTALAFIKYLPEWTTNVVLVAIAFWDLFAVLAPCGPLRVLVKLARERNDKLFPSLVYVAGVLYSLVAVDDGDNEEVTWQDRIGHSHNAEAPVRQLGARPNAMSNLPTAENLVSTSFGQKWPEQHPRQDIADGEDRTIKLGLGDFVFYSILIGKASTSGDWNTIIACFVAILVGLCITLVFLAIFQRALPALPFSVGLGLFFYYATTELITPFCDRMAAEQIFK